MSINENHAKAKALLVALATVPMFVFDIVEYELFGEYRLHPLLVEELLAKRGQFDGSISIYDNIARHYGERTAKIAESLI